MDPKIKELRDKINELENEIKLTKKDKPKSEKMEAYIPEQIFISWQSPARVFIQRDKAWFLKVAIVALLFILFFAFLDFAIKRASLKLSKASVMVLSPQKLLFITLPESNSLIAAISF